MSESRCDLGYPAEELSLEGAAIIAVLFVPARLDRWLRFVSESEGELGGVCCQPPFREFAAELIGQAASVVRGEPRAEDVLMSLTRADDFQPAIWIVDLWNRWQEVGYFVSAGFAVT